VNWNSSKSNTTIIDPKSKIPIFKFQKISNILITNDPNILVTYLMFEGGFACFEFCVLVIGIYLIFDFWCLELQ